ncbi:hypothetical protein [Frigidibacter sp. SD6-1]|uniref:hypothetical protein n=1 Tax=Frigidibacter sp. SD6-1 TaxID=3032581 RepID=UPI0024DFCC21|nr:hypothetical protein [Frigidibacter sp. SD6-1]
MHTIKTSRRHVVAGLVLGSGAAAIGNAQETLELLVDATAVRVFHGAGLAEAGAVLGEDLALSQAGLNKTLEALAQREVIGGSDLEALRRFLDTIFGAPGLPELIEAVLALYEEVIESLGDVAKMIAAVIADSADYARERLANFPLETAVLVIAHDAQSGIEGAGVGAGIGSLFPGIGQVAGAIIGGLVAGVSGSVIGYYDFAGRAR